MARNEVKWGAVLSYVLIIVNSVYGLLITPYVLSSIGNAEYGVYKTISSLSTSLMVLDLGLGGTVMRYVAKYRSEGNPKRIESFISMAFGEGMILLAVAAVVCAGLYMLLPTVYAGTLSTGELQLAKNLFVVMSFNLGLHILENLMGGVISGNNRFTFANGMKLARILFRMALIYGLLLFVKSAMVLVMIDLVLTLILLTVEWLYIRTCLHTKVKLSFRGWDRNVLGESFRYTALLFLTSIVAQMNNNLDNVVIGAMEGPTYVSIYSMGLLIFGMFEHLSTAISGVMLPTVTNALKEKDGIHRVQKYIVQSGRIQFALLGAALVGFMVLGQDFIMLWLGDGYEDVYVITLILMIPSLFELCVNVCLSVLRAKNKLGFRTAVLTATTLMNAVVTVLCVYKFGYVAAAVGTALSFIVGSLVIMNIYYCRKLSLPMLRIYREVFRGTWLCLVLSGCAVSVSARFLPVDGWMGFLINVGVFFVVYASTLTMFGLNEQEKRSVPVLRKLWKNGEKKW